MTSTLLRLYRLAKNVESQSLEDFTTEALAAAIREDGIPMIDALGSVVGIFKGATVDLVETQVPITGTGILDLVIATEGITRRTFWVEVKVGAPESGTQLDNYLARLAEDDEATRPQLIVLGPKPIRGDVPWLSWQTVYRSIPKNGAHAYWREFRSFLREINMADDTYERITEAEAKAIGSAHLLLGKAVRILEPVTERANEAWPGSKWPSTPKEIRKMVSARFRRWPNYTVHNSRRFRCDVTAGIAHDDAAGQAMLTIWVSANPKYIGERQALWKTAEEKGLQGPWKREPATWKALVSATPLLGVGDHEAASQWLIDRLDELKAAGILELIEGFTGDTSGEEGEDDGG